ncbi:carboxymuconolactone decarboxylase family protein [Candidatus Sumerlaeota bacterium]|nr:carboxymuconolactone decarboxylase family protein [Candidatus Sumerlaeota bacterium]
MIDTLARRSSITERWKVLDERIPEIMEGWRRFYGEVMRPRHLDRKTKELIMIAVVHATGCPWCIDTHVTKARREGATPEEIAEAVATASLVLSGSTLMHHVVADETQENIERGEG